MFNLYQVRSRFNAFHREMTVGVGFADRRRAFGSFVDIRNELDPKTLTRLTVNEKHAVHFGDGGGLGAAACGKAGQTTTANKRGSTTAHGCPGNMQQPSS